MVRTAGKDDSAFVDLPLSILRLPHLSFQFQSLYRKVPSSRLLRQREFLLLESEILWKRLLLTVSQGRDSLQMLKMDLRNAPDRK